MKFAFYGRVSTEDQQDPQASKDWQLSRARGLIAPASGQIIEEFFDIGTSRALPWKRRPEALRLLDTIKSPRREFQAVVIGEPQRAFYGNQFGMTFPVFVHYGVQLWVPEVGGAIDPGSDAHDLVMALYGGMSKGERNRIKIRVMSSMKAQTEVEGRFLGGRPPYGYQLADAGLHPNPAKAALGKQLHKLVPDPVSAAIVIRIFTEYLNGRGMTSIARGLTSDGIACPSAYDHKRNPHRHNEVWETTAVRSILLNPRYTGRQVWNKQRTDEVLIDVEDVALGHENKHRWNDPSQWVWSAAIVHEPLITAEQFQQVQDTIKVRGTHSEVGRARRTTPRAYLFRGLLRCGLCDRVMTGNPNHGRNYYRCLASRDYVQQHGIAHPPVLYLREDVITDPVDRFLHEELGTYSLPDTLRKLTEAQHRAAAEKEATTIQQDQLKTTLAECDTRISQYRAALDAGGDPALIAGWIKETTAIKNATQAMLTTQPKPQTRMTEDQIAQIVEGLGGLLKLLQGADPRDKAEIYTRLGLQLTYSPGQQKLIAEVTSPAIDGVNIWCPRGDLHPHDQHAR